MPPELMLLPAGAGLSIYRFSSWARGTIVPLLLLMDDRPVRPIPESARLDELHVDGAAVRPPRDNLDRILFALDRALRYYGRLPVHPLRRPAPQLPAEWVLAHPGAGRNCGG